MFFLYENEIVSLMVSLNNSFPTILLGRPSKFLGVWFHYEKNGDIFLHQLPFTKKMLTRFGMGGTTHKRKAPGPAIRLPIEEGQHCEERWLRLPVV